MNKLTPLDLALWAALPMAHTSKIEGRLIMILDSNRRRGLPRRAFIFGIALTAAALVPLAMLKPTAEAQTVPAVTDIVQIVGVADASAPAAGEWDRNGNMLQVPAFHPPAFQRMMAEQISAPPGQKALCVAFHIPTPLQQSARIIVNNSDTPLGSLMVTTLRSGSVNTEITGSGLQLQLYGNPYTYTAAFPVSLKNANFQVGVASDAGTETVDCPKTVGKVRLHRLAGDVIFTLFPHPQGGAVFMVSDHFRRTSTLKADNSLQVALHDGENYERSVYALDKSGKVLAKLAGTFHSDLDAGGRFKMEQLVSIPKPLLKRIASFRLVARPYQWTEFKDVALQPSK